MKAERLADLLLGFQQSMWVYHVAFPTKVRVVLQRAVKDI